MTGRSTSTRISLTSSLKWTMFVALLLICSHAEAARVLQQTVVLFAPLSGQLVQQTTVQQPAMQSVGQAYIPPQAGQAPSVIATQATVAPNQVTPQQGSQWSTGNNGILGQAAPQQYGQQQQAGPVTGGAGPISNSELKTTLDMHNQFRAKHQVGPLSWSSQLQASAQQWADQCVFQHSGPGENLAQYFQNFESVTQAWYDEVKDYHYDGQFSYLTGHFTEMVWKAATQLGCGYNTGCQLYVCHYNPSGNVLGSFQDNVFPPTS